MIVDDFRPEMPTAPGPRYEFGVDLDDWNGTLTQQANLIEPGTTVVEVGCATGFMSMYLRDTGCRVVGLEIDPEGRAIAQSRGLDVLDVDFTTEAGTLAIRRRCPDGYADVVLFGDVLEHLSDPVGGLLAARRLLQPDGCVVASIPNVAHGSIRLDLLRGRFRYTDTGLLDRTHVQLFTLETIFDVFARAGYQIDWLGRSLAAIYGTEGRIAPGDVGLMHETKVIADSEAWVYQYVVRAHPIGLRWSRPQPRHPTGPDSPPTTLSGPVVVVLLNAPPVIADPLDRRWLIDLAASTRAYGGQLVVWVQDRGVAAGRSSHYPLELAGAEYIGGHEPFDGDEACLHPTPSTLLAEVDPVTVFYGDEALVEQHHEELAAKFPDVEFVMPVEVC